MKTVVVMFDSLNRHMLPPYRPDTWAHAPNFARLAKRSATFDRSYVCSMPCMPARRDFHTGRPNFLHTGWCPIQPFDDSMPEMLQKAGVYTHMATDHYHYFEDGGATYHSRYSSWECFRGQEGDTCIGQVAEPVIPENINGKGRRSDWVNREHFTDDAINPQTMTFAAGVEFIERNHAEDRWMLQVECFDPHEPFTVDPKYRTPYPSDYEGPLFDWPGYCPSNESPEAIHEARNNYAALMTKCDESLGLILDAFDRHGLWEDTMLVVWTDHGYLLAEHRCWAKNWMPLYEEVSHTPLFIHDPRHPEADGQRRDALVQPAIDLAPTLLRFFGLEPTADMLGHDLGPVMAKDHAVREAAIFGYHSNRINVTDGKHVLYRAAQLAEADKATCHTYTLMPTLMRGFLGNLDQVELAEPFSFTKGMPVLKLPSRSVSSRDETIPAEQDAMYDLSVDPQQQNPIDDAKIKSRLLQHMARLMAECDSPAEQYARVGLEPVTA